MKRKIKGASAATRFRGTTKISHLRKIRDSGDKREERDNSTASWRELMLNRGKRNKARAMRSIYKTNVMIVSGSIPGGAG